MCCVLWLWSFAYGWYQLFLWVENIYQSKYGSLKAMDLVGVKYGSKVQLSRGFAFALHPTP